MSNSKSSSSSNSQLNLSSEFIKMLLLYTDHKMISVYQELDKMTQEFPELSLKKTCGTIIRFLAQSKNFFIQTRKVRHLTWIIVHILSLSEHCVQILNYQNTKKRVLVHSTPTVVQYPFIQKNVLAIIIAIDQMDEYEKISVQNIIGIINNYVQEIKLVDGSCQTYTNPENKQVSIYIEIEKNAKSEQKDFSKSEQQIINEKLATELDNCIQILAPKLYRVRNQEQVLKDLFRLNQEITHIDDIPQVMISFDQQYDRYLRFIVITVRLQGKNDPSINELVTSDNNGIITYERSQLLGTFEDKVKEASILTFDIGPLEKFMRSNSSIDLAKARREVHDLYIKKFGDFRDYNGGMLIKQQENFDKFQSHFTYYKKHGQERLEDFFYSITPIEHQATIDPEVVKEMFNSVRKIENLPTSLSPHQISQNTFHDAIILTVKTTNSELNKVIIELTRSTEQDASITCAHWSVVNIHYYSLYISGSNKTEINRLRQCIHDEFQRIKKQPNHLSSVTICTGYEPISLDPRIGSEEEKIYIENLFEGLMKVDSDGNSQKALAKTVDYDEKTFTYTFTLKKAFWSNGMRITAHDFEYSWKKILTPTFMSISGTILNIIKNAEEARNGLVTMDEVGIIAISDYELQVTLNYYAPYFLELCSHTILRPVCKVIDLEQPSWANQIGENFVCNGPYVLDDIRYNKDYIMKKNPLYIESEKVINEMIIISSFNEGKSAYDMFKQRKIDICFPPIPFDTRKLRSDPNFIFKQIGMKLNTLWFNCQTKHFKNKKIRKAISLAFNREEFEKKNPELQTTHTLLRPQYSRIKQDEGYTFNANEALKLFEEGLTEESLTRDDFSELEVCTTLILYNDGIQDFIEAVNSVLKINIIIKQYTWTDVWYKFKTGDYDICNIGWHDRVNDATYLLNSMRSKNDIHNYPRWGNDLYKNTLDMIMYAQNLKDRNEYIAKAEEILLDHNPLITICLISKLMVYDDRIEGISVTGTEMADYRGIRRKSTRK